MAITSYAFRGVNGDNKYNMYYFAVKSNGKLWGACRGGNNDGDGALTVNHYTDIWVKRIYDDYSVGADINAFPATGPIAPATDRYGYHYGSITSYALADGSTRMGVVGVRTYTEDGSRPKNDYVRSYFRYTDNEFSSLSDLILMANASYYIFGNIIQLSVSRKLVAVGYEYIPSNPTFNYCLFVSSDYGASWSTVALPASSYKFHECTVIELKENGVYTTNGRLGIFARSYRSWATIGVWYATLLVDSLGNVIQGWTQPNNIPYPQNGPIYPVRLPSGKIVASDGINPVFVREINEDLSHFYTILKPALDIAQGSEIYNEPHSRPVYINDNTVALSYSNIYFAHSETYTGTGFDITAINANPYASVSFLATAAPGTNGLLYTGSNNQFYINLAQLSTSYKDAFFRTAYNTSNIAIYDNSGNKIPRKIIRYEPYLQTGWIVFKHTSSSSSNVVVRIVASPSLSESDSTDIGDFQYDWGFYNTKGNAIDDKGNADLTVEGYYTLGFQYPWEGGNISGSNPKIGESYRFLDASSLKVYHATAMQVERTQAWTALFWYRPESLSYRELISNVDGAADLGLRIVADASGYLGVKIGDTVNRLECFSNIAMFSSLSVWRCVSVSYDGSSDVSGVTFRYNKTTVTRTSEVNTLNASILNGHALYIGSKDGTAGTRVNGYLGPVKIAYRVMSTNEIDQHYNNISNGSFWTFSDLAIDDGAYLFIKRKNFIKKRRGELG